MLIDDMLDFDLSADLSIGHSIYMLLFMLLTAGIVFLLFGILAYWQFNRTGMLQFAYLLLGLFALTLLFGWWIWLTIITLAFFYGIIVLLKG